MPVELLEHGSRYGKSHLELAFVFLYGTLEEFIHREIALGRHPPEDGAVREVVIVMGILADIKESVQTEPGWLMDLEIQTDVLFHCYWFITVSYTFLSFAVALFHLSSFTSSKPSFSAKDDSAGYLRRA